VIIDRAQRPLWPIAEGIETQKILIGIDQSPWRTRAA
jgi:hypothetical protein